ncbi:MAG: universal stress protein [Chloroflexi bacterium]|nr:universal stress protein [Chloroflexota bacterium]
MIKVLMPVDGSDHDEKTARFLGRLWRGTPLVQGVPPVEVVVVHVAHHHVPAPYVPVTPDMGAYVDIAAARVDTKSLDEQAQAEAEAIVKRAVELLQAEGLPARSEIAWGSPWQTILRLSEEGGYELIAMGSRGAGQVAGLILGSVSDRVAHRSKVPVVIVH